MNQMSEDSVENFRPEQCMTSAANSESSFVADEDHDVPKDLVKGFDYFGPEPRTLKEAIESPHRDKWDVAIHDELQSLGINHTWDIVERPDGCNVVGYKWVFKYKYDEYGNVVRFKARLVAKGYTQRENVDYFETYSPVARMCSIRFLFALMVLFQMFVHQLDVITAFLNPVLDEVVYMAVPEGVTAPPNTVLQLRKTIYGLKQSPREWNKLFDQVVLKMGFVRSVCDACVYRSGSYSSPMYLVIYVDDLLVFGKNLTDIARVKKALCDRFRMKDLGVATWYLGVRLRFPHGGVFLDQKVFTKEVLKRFNMSNCAPASIPLDPGLDLNKKDCPITLEEKAEASKYPYRSAVGCLLYLANSTRPDIAAAVGVVSQFVQNPGEAHWKAVQQILRYLQGTQDYGLHYPRPKSSSMCAFADASFGNSVDRCSVSGYTVFTNGCLTSWQSRKQKTVSLSTCEAEYVSLASAVQECLWYRNVVENLKLTKVFRLQPFLIFEDNQGTINFVKNPKDHGRMKHLDVKLCFMRQKFTDGTIEVRFLESKNMVADILTKPLPPPIFAQHRSTLGVCLFPGE